MSRCRATADRAPGRRPPRAVDRAGFPLAPVVAQVESDAVDAPYPASSLRSSRSSRSATRPDVVPADEQRLRGRAGVGDERPRRPAARRRRGGFGRVPFAPGADEAVPGVPPRGRLEDVLRGSVSGRPDRRRPLRVPNGARRRRVHATRVRRLDRGGRGASRPPVGRSVGPPVGRSTGRSVRRSVGPPVGRSAGPSRSRGQMGTGARGRVADSRWTGRVSNVEGGGGRTGR